MMDEIGYWAMETWGGATFDTMHRYLNEDPWERIRTLKNTSKRPLSPCSSEDRTWSATVTTPMTSPRKFVERACANGMDIFRTFDALNDYRNFEAVVP
jgi:oxaloacetate decarboxylase alpha subunit/pyruvate carboxylase subunit B